MTFSKSTRSTGARPSRARNPVHQASVVEAKKGLILDAAIETFLHQGYQASRIDAIGDQAGVSYATLYKHFPSKEALFEAAVDHLFHRLYHEWKEWPVPDAVEAGLGSIGTNYCKLVANPVFVKTVRMLIGEVHNFPAMGQRVMDAKNLFANLTDSWLHKKVVQGELAITDVPRARSEFIGMLSDMAYMPRLFLLDHKLSATQTRQLVASATKTFLARYRAN
jgi:TetR/AcrR family transcriptional regulator of autoinduction and epiphytic fitness